ncbi:phycobilisome rod-core linker polypeptide [Leptolyngbya sp. FACHB-541]|uniref:phycobilisome rod-core linker polypeptide n=1 Tax=Leptolyngbya sp. FACHB-541 TaxID=2692810 RepID=UPI00168475F6|nr:phycobilisome rod-core linker polypeptide [Leptolyngbya sp. FACHB-541]MBD1998681.1 phycobilisome rod-core linker polypeptide [Leptolyngbya sp. FACHB-541]
MENVTPVTVSRHSPVEERQSALHQIYQQVLERQPYSFERRSLAQAEKNFLTDKIGVRRFLKELGQSEAYLKAFYFNCSNLKFLDWCFKHFMGRAPFDHTEIELYSNILLKQGVKQVIMALLDSEEYRKAFGCFTVPYPRQQKQYESPKAYLESSLLNHEYFGQRGWVVPTLYWRQLGLNCDAGVCRHPEADELHIPVSQTAEMLQAELLSLLRKMDVAQAKQIIGSLSPQQRELLQRSLRS